MPVEYRHQSTGRQLDALSAVAGRTGATINQAVLSWLAGHGIVPVLGVSREEQLSEALTAPEFDSQAMAELDAARGSYAADSAERPG